MFSKKFAVAGFRLEHPLLEWPPIRSASARKVWQKLGGGYPRVNLNPLLINWEQKLWFSKRDCNSWSPLEDPIIRSAAERFLQNVEWRILDSLLKFFLDIF